MGEKSKVYFTDFRTQLDVPLTAKLQKLMRKAGIGTIDMDGKFVAIKMHFGEYGNLA
ncbi:MAG: 4Fe-4S ferredoxin, partial [Lachnospiraceae bacterium]|nr:4Fe-4S ferredoxin [Lachnospiraceae bacterium]